jgi:hypothetical protein
LFVVLEVVEERKDLVGREQHWIDKLQAHDPRSGYNVCPVAYSRLGVRASEATRRRQSDAMRGFRPKQTDEFRAKALAAHLGVPHSAETRRKMSESHLGQKRAPFSATHRENIRLAKLGLVVSPDTRAKLSAATSAYWQRKRESNLS